MPMNETQLKNLVIQPECSFHRDGTSPLKGQAIFVFGSNLAGRHGAGAAQAARMFFEAETGVGVGFTGHCYAIPTKDEKIETLDLETIKEHIDDFNEIVRLTPNTKFFVTRVGCGLAGYTDEQIAPMFIGYKNCSFAEEWKGLVRRP